MDNVNWELSDATGGNVNLYSTGEHGVTSGEFQQLQVGIAPEDLSHLGTCAKIYICRSATGKTGNSLNVYQWEMVSKIVYSKSS